MHTCTPESLMNFSRKHYTYINQIFGDLTIRQIITELYPSHLTFKVVNAEGFESNIHHVVFNTKTGETLCSADMRYQNINVDKNDTLCQSYSLMTYFGNPISSNKVTRQKDMITMYRTILKDKRFLRALDDILFPKNKYRWKLYTSGKGYIPMNKTQLIQDIRATLDEWEEYGYHYFIGEGTCPSEPLINNRSTRKRSRSRRSSRIVKSRVSQE